MIAHNYFSADSLTYTVSAFYPGLSLIDIILNLRYLRISSDLKTNKSNVIKYNRLPNTR